MKLAGRRVTARPKGSARMKFLRELQISVEFTADNLARMITGLMGRFRFLRERDVSGRQALRARSERSAALYTLLEILSTVVADGDGVWRRRTDLLKPLCS